MDGYTHIAAYNILSQQLEIYGFGLGLITYLESESMFAAIANTNPLSTNGHDYGIWSW